MGRILEGRFLVRKYPPLISVLDPGTTKLLLSPRCKRVCLAALIIFVAVIPVVFTGTTPLINAGSAGNDTASPSSAIETAGPMPSVTLPQTGPCVSPVNEIVAENCQPGNPASEWDISGAGDSTIQGFATDISVNRGQTVNFKVKTPANNYRRDIYRMGYYGGNGARKVATLQVSLPQTQPSCLTNTTTGLIDCGNWAESASWAVPANATSGIYFARLVRADTKGASHITFIGRNDGGTSDVLFQTSDTTWQAYNDYGGNSLYTGSPAGRAYKVSYNRPFNTRGANGGEEFPFKAEYPVGGGAEANGYDVFIFTGVGKERPRTWVS